MKTTVMGILIASLLSGCAEMAERRRQAEAARQEYAQSCASQGGVIYRERCMSPAAALQAQQQDFAAAEREKDRQTVLRAACIRRGGTYYEHNQRCVGGGSDVNVNIYR